MIVRTTVAVGVAALAVLATGCDEAEKAINKGGDTPCSDYLGQSPDDRRVTVTKFLEQDRTGSEPSAQTVDGSMAAIQVMCAAQANPETPIREADLTGIVIPR
ncbi:hypothetical protein [Nocardia bovistercoris]|uniref:Acid stress chaperone HdeA n=1 Tax=Nocardia bovistercoris TaxID=2785916 RepID=A0A931N5Z9_9NOCA|nr:hypothetical protein [Nocardia bovistercoris]MBH0780409.1 hypothetical protein [Nocardia bovistercoris]